MPRWVWAALLLALAALPSGCEEEEPGSAGSVSCDEVAAPDAQASPASAQQLVDRLEAGETGCLREGTYDGDEQIRIDTPNVTLASYPGERATIVGRMWVEPGGRGSRIQDLDLIGLHPNALPSPTVNASGVTIARNDITNENTAICLNVDDYQGSPIPTDIVIEANRIHHCGALPATNHHHGIYLAAARDTVIRGNWIYANADRGVQLYPNATGTSITGNVIDGNGQGVIFGSDDEESPDDNVVEGNLITNSTIRYNVESDSQGARYGRGNVVRRNCVYGGARDEGDGGIESPQTGFRAEDNLVADPGYLDRDAADFRLSEDSPCAEILDVTSLPPQ